MHAKTQEFLYWMLWNCHTLMRPTFRNLTDSFEAWAYREGLMPQLARLEKQGLIEAQQAESADRLYRLTPAGRLSALGGRDPEARWKRPWDGQWRLVLFDVPLGQETQRKQLRRYLRSRGFGFLQNSVWVTPDPLEQERQLLAGGPVNVEALLLLEARPCAGETDEEIVAGAWDLPKINRRYSRCLELLKKCPSTACADEAAAQALRQWAADERQAWHDAVSLDPLLPRQLLPPGYLGCEVWRMRLKTLRKTRALIDLFCN